mgnify:CR=1 FL=1
MIALKILFLLLLAFPFAVFLLFILDRLMDEAPKGRDENYDNSRARENLKARREAGIPSKRQRRKARKQRKKEQ